MHVSTSTVKYNGKKYTYVRVVETTLVKGKRKNRVVRTLGMADSVEGVDALKKEACLFLASHGGQKLRVDVSKLRKVIASPGGVVALVNHITRDYGLKGAVGKCFGSYEDCFYDEIVQRFYAMKSELRLGTITGKGKDRYYRFLDRAYASKEAFETAFFKALVEKKKITSFEVKIDTTSTYFEGDGVSIAMFGYSRDHRKDCRQVIVLLVLVDDYPLFTYVHEGNKRDSGLLLDCLADLKKKGLEKITLFTDRGFFHDSHLEKMDELEVRYVIATPRRLGEWNQFFELEEGEQTIGGRRAVLYVNHELRKILLADLEDSLAKLRADLPILNKTELKKKHSHMKKFVDYKHKQVKEKMVEKEKRVLGKCLLLTNIHRETKNAAQIMEDYKSLQEIEQDFRVLKSDLNLRPVYHQRADRVKAHLFMCVMTLLYRRIAEKDFGKDAFKQSLEDMQYQFITKDAEITWQQNKKFYDSLKR
jgi:hypothetical protein